MTTSACRSDDFLGDPMGVQGVLESWDWNISELGGRMRLGGADGEWREDQDSGRSGG